MNLNAVYVEGVAALHGLRDRTKESLHRLRDANVTQEFLKIRSRAEHTLDVVKGKFVTTSTERHDLVRDFSHIFRRKSRWELVLLSGAVCGIEFCYAAETAFVSPTLLSLGLSMKYMTMIWCLSPLVGFFLTPLLGSLSDSCRSPMGRRRPFIIILSIGILLGLILVPNGESIGVALGDRDIRDPFLMQNATQNGTDPPALPHKSTEQTLPSLSLNDIQESDISTLSLAPNDIATDRPSSNYVMRSHTWGIVFTILGTILLDFCSDACQSPSRTYLLDVTLPKDHAAGLSTFTIMAGFGGSIGYIMGAIDWEATFLGYVLGSHVRAVFTIVTILFIVCLIATIASFREIPLDILRNPNMLNECKGEDRSISKASVGKYQKFTDEEDEEIVTLQSVTKTYGSTAESMATADVPIPRESETCFKEHPNDGEDYEQQGEVEKSDSRQNIAATTKGTEQPFPQCEQPKLKEYLASIIHMPHSLRILCLTNLFCWMSLVCYSLYFTDFVGETVYGGDPMAAQDSPEFQLYQEGVRFGCWGMALYSISCSFYSYTIEYLVQKFGAKPVYVGGQLVYSLGMILMATFRHRVAVIVLSPTAGIMYATLFTMPYLLIAHYHCVQTFENDPRKEDKDVVVRGIGTDVATVSSMVFLSQFILSLSMGSIVAAVQSSVATVCAAAILSACGAVSATQIFYLEL